MNRTQILQEMGISSWVSRVTEISPPQNLQISPAVDEGGMVSAQIPSMEMSQSQEIANASTSRKEEFVHEVDLAKALEMRWVLVFDGAPEVSQIFSKIVRAVEDLGAKCQIFDLSTGSISAKGIKGDIVLAFGQKAGVLLSGERDVIENLREIVFEVQNRDEVDIPLVVTHHPRDLLKQPQLKALVWDDILWARSIWLESRL